MVFHENCLLADDSHEKSYHIFRKLRKIMQNLPSAAVVIGTLRDNKFVNFLKKKKAGLC